MATITTPPSASTQPTADLLGQAEHGPTSPAVLITTSEPLGRAVIDEIARQLHELDRRDDASGDTPRRAWTDHGVVMVAAYREHAAALSDEVATEHLEVHTAEDEWYLQRRRNYGSIFRGSRVVEISRADLMPAHEATATKRLERLQRRA
jgi:sulfopropanediol 3-dehydrogenase